MIPNLGNITQVATDAVVMKRSDNIVIIVYFVNAQKFIALLSIRATG